MCAKARDVEYQQCSGVKRIVTWSHWHPVQGIRETKLALPAARWVNFACNVEGKKPDTKEQHPMIPFIGSSKNRQNYFLLLAVRMAVTMRLRRHGASGGFWGAAHVLF